MDDLSIKEGSCLTEARQYFNDLIKNPENYYYQLLPEDLIMQAVEKGEGFLSSTGALVVSTGEFTGRSPKDRFIVKDALTGSAVDWNELNQPIEEKYFRQLFDKMMTYLQDKKLWVRDCAVCAKEAYQINIRVVNENPCCNHFAYNMFLRPCEEQPTFPTPDWHLIQLPRFFADPLKDGFRSPNFVIIHFTEKIILIGGTQYTGEIKKAVFTMLNLILPGERNVLTMHCAANVGKAQDTALFFGLSGTGKTTLSADPERKLIGDDEHGWDEDSVFNIEGGCYAKTIDLDPAKEPGIFKAIRFGALVENVSFFGNSNVIDFSSKKITENTRVSYPLEYVDNAARPSVAKMPANIFFLSADAFGILPPVSRLTPAQAMYYFISGYTAKVAGTEKGITAPKPTFSACFGAPFLPIHPVKYAQMLGEKIENKNVKVWLINTGWTGGEHGVGTRIPLEYTRAIISAALNGKLDSVAFHRQPVFGLMIPSECPGVPPHLLNPEGAWENKEAYAGAAQKLAGFFASNFKKFSGLVSKEIESAGPVIY
jgi:phosphoenolpyruvate carboxykinase (ATP)